MTTTFQDEHEHAVGIADPCPFCGFARAELWYDPTDRDTPYQVRCDGCGARGPRCDCGWEAAAFMWRSVGRALAQEKGGGE